MGLTTGNKKGVTAVSPADTASGAAAVGCPGEAVKRRADKLSNIPPITTVFRVVIVTVVLRDIAIYNPCHCLRSFVVRCLPAKQRPISP